MHTQEQLLGTLRIEDTGVPIYVQLREQFLRAMGAGALRPGDQMPTMREVAVALRVDLNTVRRAYDELERLGALTLVRGRGSFVAEPPAPLEGRARDEAAENLARQTLAQAAALGVEPGLLIERIAALAAAKEEVP
ncbi:GntR family transcriptional regulator [Phenylobacterium sp.]|uniref:GntR family transcriptional regulator n=1 Tax=Phenylobacterium sp. TaxID=1871053 RepID=UPI002FE0F0DF